MSAISLDRYLASIRDDTAALARLVSEADASIQVPTCPEWTLRQLATHVGRGQRWAAEIVARRSPEFIEFRAVPDGKLPADPELRPGWLTAGAQLLTEAIAAAPDEQVWTTGPLGPARYWARRMAHETTVHLADAQLAAGWPAHLPSPLLQRAPGLAADAVSEWLEGIAARDAPGLRGDGQSLHFHATDDGLGSGGEWLVRRTPSGVTVESGHAKADVAVRGPASGLLFVLVRRLPVSQAGIEVLGDEPLLTHLLEHTPY